MILYHITFNIEKTIEQEWLDWIKNEHIPRALSAGGFNNIRLSKLVSHIEEGLENYSVQYLSNSRKSLDNYKNNHEEKLLTEEGIKRFSNKMLTFSTELSVVEDFFPFEN